MLFRHFCTFALSAVVFLTAASDSRAVTFGFTATNSTWVSTLGTTSGYPASPVASDTNTNTILTANQTVGGITMTLTADLGGTAGYATRNLYERPASNPVGFNLSTNASYNDIAVDGVTNTVQTTGNLTNYQRWTLSFSEPVQLTSLVIEDIDNNSAGTMTFWDFLGAEAFTTATPGAVGTGIDPIWDLSPTTGLIQGSIATPDGSILFVTPSDVTNNPTNDPNYRAGITFGNVYVQSFVLYAFTKNAPGVPATGVDSVPLISGNASNTHRMSIFDGTLEVLPVPEPGTLSFALVGVVVLAASRRRAYSLSK
jgi:hypothetical protein